MVRQVQLKEVAVQMGAEPAPRIGADVYVEDILRHAHKQDTEARAEEEGDCCEGRGGFRRRREGIGADDVDGHFQGERRGEVHDLAQEDHNERCEGEGCVPRALGQDEGRANAHNIAPRQRRRLLAGEEGRCFVRAAAATAGDTAPGTHGVQVFRTGRLPRNAEAAEGRAAKVTGKAVGEKRVVGER